MFSVLADCVGGLKGLEDGVENRMSYRCLGQTKKVLFGEYVIQVFGPDKEGAVWGTQCHTGVWARQRKYCLGNMSYRCLGQTKKVLSGEHNVTQVFGPDKEGALLGQTKKMLFGEHDVIQVFEPDKGAVWGICHTGVWARQRKYCLGNMMSYRCLGQTKKVLFGEYDVIQVFGPDKEGAVWGI